MQKLKPLYPLDFGYSAQCIRQLLSGTKMFLLLTLDEDDPEKRSTGSSLV